MLMFAPRTVEVGAVTSALLETMTSAPVPGASTWTPLPLVDAQLLAQSGASAVCQNGQLAVQAVAVIKLQLIAIGLSLHAGYPRRAIPFDQLAVECAPKAMAEPGVFDHMTQCRYLLFGGMQFGSSKAPLFGYMNLCDGLGPFGHLRPDAQALINLLAAMCQCRGTGVIAGLELVTGSKRLDQGDAPSALASAFLQGQREAGAHQATTDNRNIHRFHRCFLLVTGCH